MLRFRNTSVNKASVSVHLFVSCVLLVFVLAIKSLLVCYCGCSLSLNIFAFKEIIYRNKEIKISSTDINMTKFEEGRKWFCRSVASMTNIYSWATCFTMVPVLVCVIKIIIIYILHISYIYIYIYYVHIYICWYIYIYIMYTYTYVDKGNQEWWKFFFFRRPEVV